MPNFELLNPVIVFYRSGFLLSKSKVTASKSPYWITYFSRLTSGPEQLGQHSALVSVTYVYGMVLMALAHDSETQITARILGFSSVALGFLLNVVILMRFIPA